MKKRILILCLLTIIVCLWYFKDSVIEIRPLEEDEVELNPRSRSSVLRIAEKLRITKKLH